LQETFHAYGGQLRMSEALRAGISRYTFYRARDEGLIEPVARGVYRLAELPPLGHPDLIAAMSRFPGAVLCLESALSWHEITTQIPHHVHLAVARGARLPKLDYPPVRGYRYSEVAFGAGIEEFLEDGLILRIYSAEKTLADCFKFRNRMGMDVVLEALKLYRKRQAPQFNKVLEYARICRVEKVIRPYLEAVL